MKNKMKNGALHPEPLEKSEMGLLKGGFLEVEGEGGMASRAADIECTNNSGCYGNEICHDNKACKNNKKCMWQDERPIQ